MRTVTATLSPGHKGMLRVHVDGAYTFSIPEEAWVSAKLYSLESWTDDKLIEVQETIVKRCAKNAAIRFLSIKDRTEAGLSERLQRAGYTPLAAETAVVEMKALGYLDDRRYAERQINELLRTKALSRWSLKMRLKQKGFTEDTIEAVLKEFEPNDEEAALRGVKKKFGKYDIKSPEIEKKVVSWLLHRGFGGDTVRAVLRQLKSETDY